MSKFSESLLFMLPKYVFLTICSEWMSLIDISKLDSSMTNSTMRLVYDSYLDSGDLLINTDGAGVSLAADSFTWLMTRNIFINSLTVPSDALPTEEFLKDTKVQEIFGSLKSVYFKGQYSRHKVHGLQAAQQVALIQSCVSLETLNISRSSDSLSKQFYLSLAQNCSLLKTVILNEIFEISSPVTADSALVIITNSCKLLEEVLCSSRVLNDTLVTVAENCKHLKCMQICYNVYPDRIQIDSVLVALSKHCMELREFCVFAAFTDHGLRSFVCGCKSLTRLSFRHDYHDSALTDNGLAIIADNCKHLSFLSLYKIRDHIMTVNGFGYLLKHCKSLAQLSLPHMKTNTLNELYVLFCVNRFTHLTDLGVPVDYPLYCKPTMVTEIKSKIEKLKEIVKPCVCEVW